MSTVIKRPRENSSYISPDDPPSKQKLIQAALRLFAERGVHAVTVRDVAKTAGYTNPALFKFFASKDALALFLFEHCYMDLYERLLAHAPARMDFDNRLRGVVTAFLDQLENDASAVLFVQEHLRDLWPHASRTTRAHSIVGLIRGILLDGVQEGVVNIDADRDLMGTVIIGTLAQFARLFYFGDFKKPASKYAEEIATMLLRITRR
jgi:AcrR family transcriptional regulator